MSEILLYYSRPNPTTWVYLSSFLMIGLYFVFHRFWSVRNLDLVLLILLAPGLLMVHEGRRFQLRDLESQAIANIQKDTTQANDATNNVDVASTLTANMVMAEAAPVFALMQNEAVETNSGPETDVGAEPAPVTSSDPESEIIAAEDADEIVGENVESGVTEESVYTAQDIQRMGFITLFVVQSLILVRLLVDSLMVRRPLLNPNLTIGGLNFISIALFVFMMGNVVRSTPRMQVTQGPELGPGYALMNMLPAIPTRPVTDALGGDEPLGDGELSASQERLATIAKIMAILAHLAIVTGIVLIGNRHFGNLLAGVGSATLYLMLPYTAQYTGRVDHALPAALLLWAVLNYRKPIVAGIFIGLAGGLVYYPLFLLPLWFSFYWRRGSGRFAIGVVSMLALLTVLLSVSGGESLVTHLRRMYGLFMPTQDASQLQGIWGLGWDPIMRLPVIVAFVILSSSFAAWPSPKNLGTLISGSAAVMVAAQFWHGYGGGLYIAWFLPLLLLTIFRPNLQDRVALKVVDGGIYASGPPGAEVGAT